MKASMSGPHGRSGYQLLHGRHRPRSPKSLATENQNDNENQRSPRDCRQSGGAPGQADASSPQAWQCRSAGDCTQPGAERTPSAPAKHRSNATGIVGLPTGEMTMRPLTEYERMVFDFMARRDYTRGHVTKLEATEAAYEAALTDEAKAAAEAEREDVIDRAVDRYEDWATDWATD